MPPAAQFFDALFGDKPDDLYLTIFTLPDARSSYFKSISNAVSSIEKLSAGQNDIYFGLGLHAKSHGPKRRGKTDDVAAITCVWADLDFGTSGVHSKKRLPPDEAACRKILETFPAPSIVVHSGHGLQVYWRFKEPWVFNDAGDREQARAFSQRWSTALREAAMGYGWELDSVPDLTRIFRVPGTTNYKGEPVTVKILELDETRQLDYTLEDLEQYVQGVPEKPRGEVVSIGGLVLSPGASPPFDKFHALAENEPKFKKSWDRTRTDMQDTSPSGYDLSLANFAVQCAWSDQEIANLLISARRSHGDDLKLREGYYGGTIALARRSHAVESIGELVAETVAESEHQHKSGPISDNRRKSILEAISAAFGVPILGIHRYMTAPPIYFLRTVTGDIELGGVNNLIAQDLLRQHVCNASKKVIPHFKSPKWMGLSQLLMDLVEDRQAGEETTLHGQTRHWLGMYLDDKETTEDINSAVETRTPFIKDDHKYLFLSDLRRWIKYTQGDMIGQNKLGAKLEAIGCKSTTINIQLNGYRTTRNVYQVPENQVGSDE